MLNATSAAPRAVLAQGNQVQIVIRAPLATQLLVMDLQVLCGTADSALPAIMVQYLFRSCSYGSGSSRTRLRTVGFRCLISWS
jgi:hypothetical protein